MESQQQQFPGSLQFVEPFLILSFWNVIGMVFFRLAKGEIWKMELEPASRLSFEANDWQFNWQTWASRDGLKVMLFINSTYRNFPVKKLVLLDGGVALCDPRNGVARLTLAEDLTVEDRRIWISCGQQIERKPSELCLAHREWANCTVLSVQKVGRVLRQKILLLSFHSSLFLVPILWPPILGSCRTIVVEYTDSSDCQIHVHS